jgi:hypothetical protein
MVCKLSRRRGLTGPEIVVVSSIIAILIGLLIPNTGELEQIAKQMDTSKAPNVRLLSTILVGYGGEFRVVSSGLNEVFAEAIRSGKLDTTRLRFLRMKMTVAEDEADIAVELVRSTMQDKSLSNDERKLVQTALPMLVQIRAELHSLAVLIGLLLPAPEPPAGGAAAQMTPPSNATKRSPDEHSHSLAG